MRMLDFLHKAAAIKVFEFANSYGIRWQGFCSKRSRLLCSSGRLYWSDRVNGKVSVFQHQAQDLQVRFPHAFPGDVATSWIVFPRWR